MGRGEEESGEERRKGEKREGKGRREEERGEERRKGEKRGGKKRREEERGGERRKGEKERKLRVVNDKGSKKFIPF